MTISERAIQNIFYFYPEILIDFFIELGFKFKNCIPFSKEVILQTGRIDIIFEDKPDETLHAIEIQLGDANDDHLKRLINYVQELKIKYPIYKIKGYIFAEAFSSKEVIQKSEENNILRIKFSKKEIYHRYEKEFRKTERELDLDLSAPSALGFAKLEYFNGLFNWLNLKKKNSFNLEELKLNYREIVKKPDQIVNIEKTNRFRLILRFCESFDLVKKRNFVGEYSLTNLGKKYAIFLEPINIWKINNKMQKVLQSSFIIHPFSSGIKLGIYNMLKTICHIPEKFPKRDIYDVFAFLCGKLEEWKKDTTKRDIFYFYSNYAEELGLIGRTPEDNFYISEVGRKIYAIYDNYYKTYIEAKHFLLEN